MKIFEVYKAQVGSEWWFDTFIWKYRSWTKQVEDFSGSDSDDLNAQKKHVKQCHVLADNAVFFNGWPHFSDLSL